MCSFVAHYCLQCSEVVKNLNGFPKKMIITLELKTTEQSQIFTMAMGRKPFQFKYLVPFNQLMWQYR